MLERCLSSMGVAFRFLHSNNGTSVSCELVVVVLHLVEVITAMRSAARFSRDMCAKIGGPPVKHVVALMSNQATR